MRELILGITRLLLDIVVFLGSNCWMMGKVASIGALQGFAGSWVIILDPIPLQKLGIGAFFMDFGMTSVGYGDIIL